MSKPVCIITGASSGIGEALALELGARGYSVGLVARRQELLDAIAQKIEEKGGKALAATADVTNAKAVQAAVQAIEATLGPCELLIANAGGSLKGQREGSIDYEGTLATFRLNVDGVIHSLAAVVPGMEARKSGKIAIVSSVASLRGMPGFGGYGSAKAAISNFAEAMRIALAPKGISVTTIQPGFIKTPLTAKNKFPMPFMLEADEAARRIIRAIERKKAIYTFPFPMWLAYEIGIRIPVFIWDRMIRLGMPKDS